MASAILKLAGVSRKAKETFMVPVHLLQEVKGFNARDEGYEVEDIEQFVLANGIENLTPVVAFLEEDALFLVAGHRRKRAVENLISKGHLYPGVPTQLTSERDPAKLQILSMAENNGVPLTPMEQAKRFGILTETPYNWSVEDIAREGGWSPLHVRNRLTLLHMDSPVKDALDTGIISKVDAVKVVRTAAKTGKTQSDVLTQMTHNKSDGRTRAAKEVPIAVACQRALTPLIAKFGLELCISLLDRWPVAMEDT